MSWYTSGQHDTNEREFLLNSAHGSYESKRAIIESLSPNYAIADGAAANTKVVTGYVTDAELASNSLDIGGAVLDWLNHVVNTRAGVVRIRTNEWGDAYRVWSPGSGDDPGYLEQPQSLPTTPVDRTVQHWKDAGETLTYVAQAGAGTEDGSTYANRMAWADFDGEDWDGVIWCGDIWRDSTDALVPFIPKSGIEASRTFWMSHPADPCRMLGLRYATYTDQDGAWRTSAAAVVDDYFVYNTLYGALTQVASVAACKALANSYFPDAINSFYYVNLEDDSNPATTTFFQGGLAVYFNSSDTPATGKSYFDIYGIKFYLMLFGATVHYYATNYRFYGCEFSFSADGQVMFGVTGRGINLDTGQYVRPGTLIHDTPDIPDGREWHGCYFSYATSGIYDTGFLANVPTNTVVRDCWFYGIGKDAFGVSIRASSDSHSIASQGSFDVLLGRNNVFDNDVPQTFVIYTFDGGHRNRNTTLTDAAITNGTFATDLTGWTNLSTGGTAGVAPSGGKAVFTVGGGTAALEQEISFGAAYLTITDTGFSLSTNVATLSGTPDLSALSTSGDNQAFIQLGVVGGGAVRDAAGINRFKITAVNDGTDEVTLSPTPTLPFSSMSTERDPAIIPWKIGRPQFVKFTVFPKQSVKVAVRTASGLAGGSSVLAATLVTGNETSGVAAISFEPEVSPVFLQFIADSGTHDGVQLDNVEMPTSLAAEPGFATSLPADKVWFDPKFNYHYVMQKARNIHCLYSLFVNPIANADGENAPVSWTGDITKDFGGQISGNKVQYCRFEGTNHLIAIRNKFCLASPYDHTQMEFSNNVIRGAERGIRGVGTSPDENGEITEPSYWAHDNDIHATLEFVLSQDGNPDRHKIVFEGNTYRNDDGADWRGTGGTATTLAAWNALGVGNDTYDDDSVHIAFTTDTGSPSLTAAGGPLLGSTLAVSLGADPDGAITNEQYQVFRDGVVLEGAEATSYAATVGNGNAVADAITWKATGDDAKGKQFLVTSNAIELTGTTPSPPPPPQTDPGGPTPRGRGKGKPKKRSAVGENDLVLIIN